MPDLTALKAFLNIPGTSSDNELQDILDAAVDLVSALVGPLDGTPVTETHYGVAAPLVVLRQAPVLSVASVSVSLFPGYAPVSYVTADLSVDLELGVLRLVGGGRWTGDVTVVYTAGWDVVPAAVDLACLVIAGHLWETQRGVSPSALALQGGEAPQPGWSGYAIPNRATDLLAPYRQLHVS